MHMKKVLTIIAIAGMLTACDNNSDASDTANDSVGTPSPDPIMQDTASLGMDTIMPNVTDTAIHK
jgi:uncharacterized lipoprotein YajG